MGIKGHLNPQTVNILEVTQSGGGRKPAQARRQVRGEEGQTQRAVGTRTRGTGDRRTPEARAKEPQCLENPTEDRSPGGSCGPGREREQQGGHGCETDLTTFVPLIDAHFATVPAEQRVLWGPWIVFCQGLWKIRLSPAS